MGPELAVYLAWGVGIPLALWSRYRGAVRASSSFQETAAELELTLVEARTGLLVAPRLVAEHGSRRVVLERVRKGKRGHFVRVVVDGNAAITLAPEAPASALGRALQRETEIGDEVFDDAVHVLGSPAQLRAILDPATRDAVLRLFAGWIDQPIGKPRRTSAKVRIDNGDLIAEFPVDASDTTPSDLAWLLRSLLHHAPRFNRPRDPAQRIADNLPEERAWRARQAALELLAVSYPKHPSTTQALRRAGSDPRFEVRAYAALTLDDPERLLAIATEARDDVLGARAITALGGRAPLEPLRALLEDALRRRKLAMATACVHGLGWHGAAAAELLGKVLAREQGELAVAAAQALGRTGCAAAQGPLLQALDPGEPELAVAVVAALGAVGNVAAVLPVRDAADDSRSTRELRRAARQAVAEIQARLPGASPGQLSVADAGGEAGRVSLVATEERGRVSLAGATTGPAPPGGDGP